MESWDSLGGKEGYTNIRISAKPGIEPGAWWLEDRDLANYAKHAQNCMNASVFRDLWALVMFRVIKSYSPSARAILRTFNTTRAHKSWNALALIRFLNLLNSQPRIFLGKISVLNYAYLIMRS